MEKQENAKDRKIRNQRKEIERLIKKNKQLESYILHGYYASNPNWGIAGGDIMVKSIFNPKPEKEKVVFINCFDEKFTEKYLRNHRVYWVQKGNLEIFDNAGYCTNELSCKEDSKGYSEIFKTKTSAEKWIEQYKVKRLEDGFVFDEDKKEFRELKLDEIHYEAVSPNDLFYIYKNLPKELISGYYDIDMTYPIVTLVGETIINRSIKEGYEVSKEAFIRIMKNNN